MRDRLRYWMEGAVLEPKRTPVFKFINLLDNKFQRYPKHIIIFCVAVILTIGFGEQVYDFLKNQSEKSDATIGSVLSTTTRSKDAPASD